MSYRYQELLVIKTLECLAQEQRTQEQVPELAQLPSSASSSSSSSTTSSSSSSSVTAPVSSSDNGNDDDDGDENLSSSKGIDWLKPCNPSFIEDVMWHCHLDMNGGDTYRRDCFMLSEGISF